MDEKKDVLIIEIPGRLGMNNAEELRKAINTAIEQQNYKIVLDLVNTKYLDSTGLSSILSRISDLRSGGGDVRLAFQSDFIKELLTITNLDKILNYFDDVSTAVDSFS
jgi:anti-sigma B factor antagonist